MGSKEGNKPSDDKSPSRRENKRDQMAANKIAQATTKQSLQARGKKDVHLKTAEECPHTFSRGTLNTSLHDTLSNQQSTTGDEGNDHDRLGETQ